MTIKRKKTRETAIGSVKIGGENPIAIQSMTNTDTHDVQATVEQITGLEAAGCDIVRVAVPDDQAVTSFAEIVKQVKIPVVADIHFDHRLAIQSIEAGAAKIRIGLNKGSYEGDLIAKALEYIDFFGENNFEDIVLSIKSSSVRETVVLNRQLSQKTNYPLHIGVTESGTLKSGLIKSAAGIGALLMDGIGDTIRISLTADPVEEVLAAKRLLGALKMIDFPEVISCPTCGRTEIDLIPLAEEVERFLIEHNINKKVAVMGCVVNGPGEAREADYGIAGGKGEGLIFARGEIIKKVKESELLPELFQLLKL